MNRPVTLYGIPNCDTVKKARSWLDAHGIVYQFHDFKKAGLDGQQVGQWLSQVGWEVLVNRKGTTWRGLDEARKAAVVDADSARSLMLENPSVIKRPVLQHGERTHVGFSEASYREIFNK